MAAPPLRSVLGCIWIAFAPAPENERGDMSNPVTRLSKRFVCSKASLARSAGVAALAVLLGATAACTSSHKAGTSAASRTSGTKPTLTIALPSPPQSFDPSKNEPNYLDQIPLSLMYAPLLHQNPNGSISAGLATSWGYVGSGNKTFQLTLRNSARFSDGSPVTAQTVSAWLTYFPKAHFSLASDLAVQSIDTKGQSTVIIHLKSPNPLVPTILSEAFNWGFVASPRFVANPNLFTNQGGGAGPYVMLPSETVTGDHYTFVPNKYFYDQSQIHYSKIVEKVIASASSMLAAVQTGQVQVALGDPTTANAAKAAGLNVIEAPTQTESFEFLDLAGKTLPPLGNVKVRQALNYAINRSAIAKALGGPGAKPTSEFVTTDGFDPNYQSYYTYDPSKAKALLAEAGYSKGFTISLLSPTFLGSLGDTVTQAVAQDLSAIGVKVNIVTEPTASAYDSAIGSGTEPGFELLYGGDPMSIQYGFYFAPKAPFNQHGWDDPLLDNMWRTAQALPPAKGSRYWLAMSDRTVTQADMLPIFTVNSFMYVSKSVTGVAFSSHAPVAYPTEWLPT